MGAILPARLNGTTFDVAIIGAGPAGSAAARLLSSWGHSVAVLGRPSRHPPLAESLPPSCTKLFDQMGLRKAIDGAGFVRATGNTVQWAGRELRVEPFDIGPKGYQVARHAFDLLLNGAACASGAVVCDEAMVRDAERVGDYWQVAYEANGESQVLRGRWLLDCSGRTGVIARRGWRRTEPRGRTTAVVSAWERAGPWKMDDDTHTFVESYDGGWAWSVPVSSARRFVTVMLDPSVTALPTRAGLEAAYHAELSRTTALKSLVEGAVMVDAPWACDASPYFAERVADDHLLLVGDAASFVDPLSSFGVKKALASAWLASVVVHTALTDEVMTSPAVAFYGDRERDMYVQLQRQFATLARDAAGAHDGAFWRGRSDADDVSEHDAKAAAVLREPLLRASFELLKSRDSLHLVTGDALRIVDRATVEGHRIALQQQLATPELPGGIRFYRNVDLVLLLGVAVRHDQVPSIFDAYNRLAPPAPLPDFLAALSALLGMGALSFA
ncbi:MAG: FAD-dependent monooxygenase [bacterium]